MNSESSSTISSEEANKPFTAYLVLGQGFELDTKNFANLKETLIVVEIIPNSEYLCELYKVHTDLLVPSDMLLDVF